LLTLRRGGNIKNSLLENVEEKQLRYEC